MRTPQPNGDDEPLTGKDRTDEFLFELYRAIVAELSEVPEDFYYNDMFIELSIDGIVEQYEDLTTMLTEEINFDTVLDQLNEDVFKFNGTEIRFTPFNKWTFNKWVTFENAMKGQYAEDENGDLVQVAGGELFVLPVCFGEWVDEMPDFEEKFLFFNYELKAAEVIPVFARVNGLINLLKENHNYIYSESGDETDAPTSFRKHVENFGWLETLRDLAEKRVFGDYLQTKKANALQVLEYLNCSISKEIAKNEDFIKRQSKNKK